MGRPFSCFVYKRICSLLIILGLGRLNQSKVMESFPPTLPGFNSLYNTLVIFVVVFFLVFQSLDHPLSEIHRLEHLCTKNTAIQIRYWKPQPIQHFIFGKTRNSFLFFILYFLEKQRVKRVRSPIRSRELEIESHSRSVSPSFIHLPVANTKIPSVVFRSNEQQFLTVSKSDNWSVPQPPRSRCDFVTRGVSGMVPGLRLLGAVFDYPGNLGFLHVESNAGKSSAWKRPAHSEMILLWGKPQACQLRRVSLSRCSVFRRVSVVGGSSTWLMARGSVHFVNGSVHSVLFCRSRTAVFPHRCEH